MRTPSATATVRGTAFEFDVDDNGTAEVTTTDGTVATTANGKTVHVGPGQRTEAPAGAEPKDPSRLPSRRRS